MNARKIADSSKKNGVLSDSLPEVPQPLELEHTHTGYIHKGCERFSDPEKIVSSGPITRIEIAHSDFIYGIRLFYGRDGQGFFHLGLEEQELKNWGIKKDKWKVPPGEMIVGIEGEIAGHYMSRLKFLTDGGKESIQFGGQPGTSYIINEPDSGGLRTISGYVNKRRHEAKTIHRAIASMTFHFGAPCYIKNIEYDLDALEAARLKAAPEGLKHQEIPNRTSVEQTVTYSDTKKITMTKTLTFRQALGFRMGSKVSLGAPGVASGEISFELSASNEFGESYASTSEWSESWSIPVKVPAGKKIIADSTIKQYQATVPFTYTIAWYMKSRENIIKEVTLPGEYSGIHVEDLEHSFRELSLE